MKPEKITSLAREYAEELCPDNKLNREMIELDCLGFLDRVLNNYCLVEKSKIREAYKDAQKDQHNSEGEEMLTCDRDVVRMLYDRADSVKVRQTLESLFGSQCLPDNVATSEPNVDSSVGSVESLDPKPAEPKFKVGDKVRYRCDGKIHEVKAKTGKYHYALSGLGHDVHEEYLEPYTEPKETKAEEMADKAIKPAAEQFDNILKDSFSKERRLTIAARMMQGLICAPLVPGVDPNPPAEQLAQTAFRLADALIAEWRKG